MNLYFTAAQTLDRIDTKQGSIKGILSTLPGGERKRVSALTIETLKYKPVLSELIETCAILKQEKKLASSRNLTLVLVHDLLFTKGGIQAGDGPIKQAVLRHKTRLKGELQKLKIKRDLRSDSELQQNQDERGARIPRYARVNTNVSTLPQVLKKLAGLGYSGGDPFASKSSFQKDLHIPNLLLFHPQAPLMEQDLYKHGSLILQDKASCMPAIVLAPPSKDDAVVIDATAAPGNKTSHLSALMQNCGTLIALERDRKRYNTLSMMLDRAHCKNVQPRNVDFLSLDPADSAYARVTHILLDPSCSGSGIVNRMDYLTEQVEEESEDTLNDRLRKLADFQLSMIRHAMRFPAVSRIVYSTCSIHAEENERVVSRALASEESRAGHFELASRQSVLPFWPRRGLSDEFPDTADLAERVIRCSPDEDATNGFFVSCFVRRIGEDAVQVTVDHIHGLVAEGEEEEWAGIAEIHTAEKHMGPGAAKSKKRRKQSKTHS